MGEMADDAVEGMSCMWCGVYFEEEHGFPVLCVRCAEEQDKLIKAKKIDPRLKIEKATHLELS